MLERVQIIVEGGLPGLLVEPLLTKPTASGDAPGLGRHPQVVSRQQLAEPMTCAHPLDPGVLPRPDQIAGRLEPAAGNEDRLQQPRRVQLGQLARVARIRLDPVARPLRHTPRRDHLARDAVTAQIPIQPEAGGPSLIATTHSRPAPQRLLDKLVVVRQRPLLDQLLATYRGQTNRTCVHVQPHRYRRRLAHGRRPPYVALPGAPRQPTTNAQAPTTLRQQPDTTPLGAAAPSCLGRSCPFRPWPGTTVPGLWPSAARTE
jgi:hypothetical protein